MLEGEGNIENGVNTTVGGDMINAINYYKNSLIEAGNKINQKKQNKALKDVVGNEYEHHRKRVWESLGFTVDKERNGASFDVDWSIYYNNTLVAIEEDKGHYVDSCFFGRCIHSFIGSTHDIKGDTPALILSSFTKYNLYETKKNKSLELYKDNLVEIFNRKFHYNYLNDFDRIKRDNWFKSDNHDLHNPYAQYLNDELIHNDIEFMLSLQK